MKNWLTCDANKGRRGDDEGWSKEMTKDDRKNEEGDWSTHEREEGTRHYVVRNKREKILKFRKWGGHALSF